MNAVTDWVTTVAPTQLAIWSMGIAAGLISLCVGAVKLRSAFIEINILRISKAIQSRSLRSHIIPDFTKNDIKDSVSGYIIPDCAQTDPSNSDDARRIAAVRERVYDVVDRFVESNDARHLLILADTGMGKTTFCLNYLYHRERNNKKRELPNVAVIPLGRPGALEKISRISSASETILILDAFDEDSLAMNDAGQRISELMAASASFQNVIVTCRSQFFSSDNTIPSRTGVAVVRPRSGLPGEYSFQTLYLLPFSPPQIDRYIRAEFPFVSIGSLPLRNKARALAADVRELSARPLLLTLIPDLIRTGKSAHELFELYTFMIETWNQREEYWIDSSKLNAISTRLSTFIYTSRHHRQTDRVTVGELNLLAKELNIPEQDWQHLRARSLLNRDSEGNIKFSHRSIMEYFFVKAAIAGDKSCFDVYWSDFMRELFVSWGNTNEGRRDIGRAKQILAMDLTKIGLSPLSKPLETSRDYKLSAYLQKPASRSRIPKEWRGYSLRMGQRSGQNLIQDDEYGLIWDLPDLANQDLAALMMSYHEVGKTRLPRVLASKDQFLSLLEVEQKLGIDFLPRDTFMWLGDRLGRGRPIAVTISAAGLVTNSARLLGPLPSRDRHGMSVWAYEPTPQSGTFGAKAAILRALPIRVAEVDHQLRRRMHMMSPEDVTRHFNLLAEDAEIDWARNDGDDTAQTRLKLNRATKRPARAAKTKALD